MVFILHTDVHTLFCDSTTKSLVFANVSINETAPTAISSLSLGCRNNTHKHNEQNTVEEGGAGTIMEIQHQKIY